MKRLDKFIGNLDQCVKCGACRSGCPTFTAVRREGASARGRLSVVSAFVENEFGSTAKYKEHIKNCTLCGSCASICPMDVDTPKIVLSARAASVEKEGLPLTTAFVLKHVLDSKRFGSTALKMAAKLQAIGSSRGGDASRQGVGLISRYILPYLGDGRSAPPLARQFFLDTLEARSACIIKDAGEGGSASGAPRVAFFVGCGINYMLPDIGRATMRVLKEAGADIVVPPEQSCCGMPALSMGDVKTAKSLALKNLELFEALDVDFITTSCATCTYALKTKFVDVLSDAGPEVTSRVERFVAKVRDITELLDGEFSISAKEKTNETVTYHDPCHLSRGQSIKDAPRNLLDKSEMTFTELKNPCRCCGLGGGLGYTNYKLSMEIAVEKARNIALSKADVVATACPGCMIQIKDGLDLIGAQTRVRHIVELL